jgi:hypothetical protein
MSESHFRNYQLMLDDQVRASWAPLAHHGGVRKSEATLCYLSGIPHKAILPCAEFSAA